MNIQKKEENKMKQINEEPIICYGKYIPTENVQLINGMSEEEIRSLNPEYYDFMEQYNKEHAVCPECGSKHYTKSLVGYVFNNEHPEEYKDKNTVQCMNCGWHGIIHDLVAEKL